MDRNNQSKLILTSLVSLGLMTACASQPQVTAEQKTETTTTTTTSTVATPAPVSEAEHKQDEVVLPKSAQAAVNSSYRTLENTNRDQYRHPLETLNFFGVKPNMTVVEITPGAGWYTEILTPLLATEGQYIAAIPPAGENKGMNETSAKVIAWIKSHKEFEGHATIADFAPPDSLVLAPEGSADMVLTFRNIHNWMARGYERAVFESFFKSLKPGGVLGIEEHRANPKAPRDGKASSGYVLEKDVIRLAESVGFKLAAKSEINANKRDTKNYPDGVWTLPPTLRLKDQDREKYMAIGESDRMTLRFVKPRK